MKIGNETVFKNNNHNLYDQMSPHTEFQLPMMF